MLKKTMILVAGVTLLSACTNQTSTAPVSASPAPAPTVPATGPAAPNRSSAAVLTSMPDELPPGAGREAVLKGCGGCHGIGQILTERRNREEWANTVTMMITQGAPVSEAEFDSVVAYLATHFGPR